MDIFEDIQQKINRASLKSKFRPPSYSKTKTAERGFIKQEKDNPDEAIAILRNEIIPAPKKKNLPPGDMSQKPIHPIDRVPESLYPLIDIRLNICKTCKFFSSAGCIDCKICGGRWTEWHKRVVNGTCKEFQAYPEAEFLSEEIRSPNIFPKQRKVNNMFVYLYTVLFTTPDNPSGQNTIQIVAQDIKSVMHTLEEIIPGANLIAAPIGVPIDAIADGIIADNLEKHNISTAPEVNMIPTPYGPMTPEQLAQNMQVIGRT